MSDCELTHRQDCVLSVVRAQRKDRERGLTTMEIYAAIHAKRDETASYATLRNDLVRLRELGLVWSYGAYVKGNATCWHPDPPAESRRQAAVSPTTEDGRDEN